MKGHSYFISDYTGLVSKIGIHFQVRDDYMNLQSKQVSKIITATIPFETHRHAPSMLIIKVSVKT